VPAAVAVAPSSLVPANRPQGSHWLQTWVPHACNSCYGSWNQCPKARRPQGLCCLVDTRGFKPAGFAASRVPSSYQSVPGACYHTLKWTPGSKLYYSASTRRLTPPKSMEAQHSTLFLTANEPSLLCQRARMPILHWGEVSYNLVLCRWHQKSCFPKLHSSSALHTVSPCRSTTSLMSKNSSSSTEWQPATLLC
jgi:hypothetical protein